MSAVSSFHFAAVASDLDDDEIRPRVAPVPRRGEYWCGHHDDFDAVIQFLLWFRPDPARLVNTQITNWFQDFTTAAQGPGCWVSQQMIIDAVVSVIFENSRGPGRIPLCFLQADHWDGLWSPITPQIINNPGLSRVVFFAVRSFMNAHYASLSQYERVSEAVDNLSAFLPPAGGPAPADVQPSGDTRDFLDGDTRDFLDEILDGFDAGPAPAPVSVFA